MPDWWELMAAAEQICPVCICLEFLLVMLNFGEAKVFILPFWCVDHPLSIYLSIYKYR